MDAQPKQEAKELRPSDLSFTAMRDGKALPKPVGKQLPRCFWHVKPTGNYGKDCQTGEKLAIEYLAFERARARGENFHPLLNSIVEDMPRPLTGVEHGFLIAIGFGLPAAYDGASRVVSYWARCRAGRKTDEATR